VFKIFVGQRPDITPAQTAAGLVAGIPVLATLLTAFGIAELTAAQQDALADALTWGGVLAGLLIGGDATLRTARNVADARRDSAAIAAGTSTATPAADPHDAEVDALEAAVVVTDDEEFSAEDEPDALEARLGADDPDLLRSDAP
jgi:hypothetical protein